MDSISSKQGLTWRSSMLLDYFPLLQCIEIRCWNYSIQRPCYTNQTSSLNAISHGCFLCFLLFFTYCQFFVIAQINSCLSTAILFCWGGVHYTFKCFFFFFLLTWTKGVGDFFLSQFVFITVCLHTFHIFVFFSRKKSRFEPNLIQSHFL